VQGLLGDGFALLRRARKVVYFIEAGTVPLPKLSNEARLCEGVSPKRNDRGKLPLTKNKSNNENDHPIKNQIII